MGGSVSVLKPLRSCPGVFSTNLHVSGDPHSSASLRNHAKRASMVCAAGKGTLEPITIHVVLPNGERDTWTIAQSTSLDKYLNRRRLGGAELEDSSGKKVVDAEFMKDGEVYKVLPLMDVATLLGVTLQVPDDDGSLVDLVYASLSQQELDSIMSANDLAGFVDATAQVQMVTKRIDDMSSNGCYTGVPNPRTGLAVRVNNLEVEARNTGKGLEDSAGAKVAKLAREEHPLSSIEPLPVKEFKDATGKQTFIELYGGAVVHTPSGGVLYVVDHKRTLASGDLVKVATLPGRLKKAALASPALADVLKNVKFVKLFVCTESVVGASRLKQMAVLDDAHALGVSVLTLSGDDYDLAKESSVHHDLQSGVKSVGLP